MIAEPATIGGDEWPEAILGVVKPELQPGERLLWADSARERPSGVTRTGWAALVWAVGPLTLSAGSFYAAFGPTRQSLIAVEGGLVITGIISGLVGIIAGLIVISIEVDKWSNQGRPTGNTYALTDRRAIIWAPIKNPTSVHVHTFVRGAIKAVYRLEYPDGSGDVYFKQSSDEVTVVPNGFIGVADIRRVEDLVRMTLVVPRGPADT